MEAEGREKIQPWSKYLAHAYSPDHLCGHTNNVESIQGILWEFEVATTTKFTYKKSRGDFGVPIDRDTLVDSIAKHKIRFKEWDIEDGDKSTLHLDGTPFLLLGEKWLECHHGPQRQSQSKEEAAVPRSDHDFTRKKCHLQNTKKFGCAAKIKLKDVIIFPRNKPKSGSKRQRTTSSKIIKTEAEEGSVYYERRIYIELPAPEEHSYHHTSWKSGIQQPVDAKIIAKIYQLVGDGVRTVTEMKRHLEILVKTSLFAEQQCPPKSNRRFFPRNRDIRNHMGAAIRKRCFSKLDQDNLEQQIAEWRTEELRGNDLFFFRKAAEVTKEGPMRDSSEPATADCNEVPIMDEEMLLSATTKQSMLFIHQTQNQKDLLARYGNEITCLDATHRTTKYDVPLFFLVVPTNCGYQIVAQFTVSEETTAAIREALSLIREENPNWHPKRFMTDFSDEEMNAINRVFPDCETLLCDFHREQAWERWLSTKSHSVTEWREVFLAKFRKIARSCSESDFTKAVDDLKASDEWNQAEAKMLRSWFDKKWLPVHKKWVWAFRTERTLLSVNTNNGVESKNKTFKHSYLRSNRHLNLSAMAKILLEEYIPDCYKEYVDTNNMWSPQYKKYNSVVHEHLRNRPHPYIKHCTNSIMEAENIPANYVKPVDESVGVFLVQSCSVDGISYDVDFSVPKCSCHQFMHSGMPCKHMYAIWQYSSWEWSMLPKSYMHCPFFILDENVSDPYSMPIRNDVNDVDYTSQVHCVSEEIDEGSVALQLPLSHKVSKCSATKCRDLSKKILNLTYLIEDDSILEEAQRQMEATFKLMEPGLKKSDGLTVHHLEPSEQMSSLPPESSHRTDQPLPPGKPGTNYSPADRQRSDQSTRTVPLPRPRKRKCPLSGRVGSRAQMLRATTNVKTLLPLVPDSLDKTPQDTLTRNDKTNYQSQQAKRRRTREVVPDAIKSSTTCTTDDDTKFTDQSRKQHHSLISHNGSDCPFTKMPLEDSTAGGEITSSDAIPVVKKKKTKNLSRSKKYSQSRGNKENIATNIPPFMEETQLPFRHGIEKRVHTIDSTQEVKGKYKLESDELPPIKQLHKSIWQQYGKAEGEEKKKSVESKDNVIDLTVLPTVETTNVDPVWLQIGEYQLRESHYLRLSSTDGWLDDTLVNAAQHLLNTQFPQVGGFQDTTKSQDLSFDIRQEPFIQILNVRGCHWITVSTKGTHRPGWIRIFDSLNHTNIDFSLKQVLAAIMCEKQERFMLKFENVPQQMDSSSCGLYALAYAFSLCSDQDPRRIVYNERELRSHLISCFENGKMTSFPISHDASRVRLARLLSIPVYCHCRLPWPEESDHLPPVPGISCSHCLEWFHIGICEKPPSDVVRAAGKKWFCRDCAKTIHTFKLGQFKSSNSDTGMDM